MSTDSVHHRTIECVITVTAREVHDREVGVRPLEAPV